MATFNNKMNPKAKTELFKIYIDVGTKATPEYELQGRGVTSWTIDNNQDMETTTDVLGYNDFERGVAQPQQEIDLVLRKESKLASMLFDAWFSGDQSALDSISILQKFEFAEREVTGASGKDCLARLQDECAINIASFNGEAGGNLSFSVTIHYSNKITKGYMPKVDPDPVTFKAEGGGGASAPNFPGDTSI